MTGSRSGGGFAAFRHRPFTIFWLSLVVSNTGTWMQTIGQNWLIYQQTNRATDLGLISLAFAIPMILLPPFGGVVVDRIPIRRLLLWTQSCSLVLALVATALAFGDLIRVWNVVLLNIAGATLLALDNPGRQTLVPELVPRNALQNALSVNSAAFTGAALIGPALAGTLLPYLQPQGLFLLNAFSYLAVIGALLALRRVGTRRRSSGRVSPWAGFAYVLESRTTLVLLLVLALSGILGRSFQPLLPVFASEVFRAGSGTYGLLVAAPGLGALLGAFGLAAWGNVRRKDLMLLASGVASGATLALFTRTHLLALALPLLVLAGAASTVLSTLVATLIQLRVPPELRGRVMSLYTLTLIGVPSLAALGVSLLAERPSWDAPRAIFASGMALVVVMVLTAHRVLRAGREPQAAVEQDMAPVPEPVRR